jgi:acylphosphatase
MIRAEMEHSNVRVRIYVYGTVQGVFFRFFVKEKALQEGIEGWVRNRPDNSVEALFEGEENKIIKMIEWCKIGPSAASVRKVDIKWEKYEGGLQSFEIVH